MGLTGRLYDMKHFFACISFNTERILKIFAFIWGCDQFYIHPASFEPKNNEKSGDKIKRRFFVNNSANTGPIELKIVAFFRKFNSGIF